MRQMQGYYPQSNSSSVLNQQLKMMMMLNMQQAANASRPHVEDAMRSNTTIDTRTGKYTLEEDVRHGDGLTQALSNLPKNKVASLNLANNELNDDAIRQVALTMRGVKVLNLANNRVTETGVSYLINLIKNHNLRGVNLSGNPLSNKAVVDLYQAAANAGMNPQNIIVDRNNLTAGTQQQIQVLSNKAKQKHQQQINKYNAGKALTITGTILSVGLGTAIVFVAANPVTFTLGLAFYFSAFLLGPALTKLYKEKSEAAAKQFKAVEFPANEVASSEHQSMLNEFFAEEQDDQLGSQDLASQHDVMNDHRVNWYDAQTRAQIHRGTNNPMVSQNGGNGYGVQYQNPQSMPYGMNDYGVQHQNPQSVPYGMNAYGLPNQSQPSYPYLNPNYSMQDSVNPYARPQAYNPQSQQFADGSSTNDYSGNSGFNPYPQ